MKAAATALRFEALRRLAGLSLWETCRVLGVSKRRVERWEAGTAPVPEGVIAQVQSMAEEVLALAQELSSRDGELVVDRQVGVRSSALAQAAALALAIDRDMPMRWADEHDPAEPWPWEMGDDCADRDTAPTV